MLFLYFLSASCQESKTENKDRENIHSQTEKSANSDANKALQRDMTTQPELSTFQINENSIFTNSLDVTITTVGSDDAVEMILFDNADCSGKSEWETINTQSNRVLIFNNTEVYISAKVRNSQGVESECISDSIIHDNIPPESHLDIESGLAYTSNDKVDIRIKSTDASEMVLSSTEDDCKENNLWEKFSETISKEINAKDAVNNFYLKTRDAAGNISECVKGSIIHTLGPSLSLLNTPADPNENNTISVLVEGENINEYKYKLLKNNSSCQGEGYGPWTAVSEPISEDTSEEATYTLCVVARNLALKEGYDTFTWTKGIYWNLELETSEANQEMIINFSDLDQITIDWGDGNKETNTNENISHIYETPGTYNLRLKGVVGGIKFRRSLLTKIKSKVQGITGLTTFAETFYGQLSLTGNIPPDLFENCPNVTDFTRTFSYTSLTGSIPADLFKYTPNVTTFESTFERAQQLTGPIPEGLFSNNLLVTNFTATFFYADRITGPIPEKLFFNNPNATSFLATFADTRSLSGAIPGKLFSKNVNALNFDRTFTRAFELNGSIPADLFSNNINATSFDGTFDTAVELTGAIPEALFANNREATNFNRTFYYAVGLTSIPTNLFINNQNATSFNSTFRFSLNLTGNAPNLWETHPTANGVACFNNLTNLDNYDLIPANWK